MKVLNDKLQKRSTLINEMETILKTARDENRQRTEAESNEWTAKRNEVNALTAEIDVLQEQAELNRSIADTKLDKEERNAVKAYDLTKAIESVRSGQPLEGLERELNEEALKEVSNLAGQRKGNLFIPSMVINSMRAVSKRANEETKTTGLAAGHIPTQIGGGSVITPLPLYDQLGCTVYENLTSGKIDLPFSKGHTAAKVAEAGTASQSVPTDTKGTLTAARYQGWQKYTDEYLAESALMPAMLADMVAAIDRGIGKAMLADAVAVNVMTGYATSDTKAAMTWVKALSQISELESDGFVNEAFVASKELFFKMAGIEKASNTAQFIVDKLQGGNKGFIGGVPAFGSAFLAVHDTDKYDSLYGDFKEAYIGFWGGVQLLIDPYSASDDGYTKITFMRLAAVDSNPYAFASIRNASI